MFDTDSITTDGMESSFEKESNHKQNGPSVFIKISIPDIDDEKLLQFPIGENVTFVKKTILSMLDKELKDSQNYGLFLPPVNGKTGKFLQEERTLKEYAFHGTNPQLELKYKRRIFRSIVINPSKLKKVHSKSNLRQLMDNIKSGDVSKVTKWLNKGMDPNFHAKESGESPLSLASVQPLSRDLIMALVSGGAHLDFRDVDTMTPLHNAAKGGNFDAVKTLLDLGQSPNTFDKKGLTPLYYAVVNDNLSLCVERLLYDHSIIGLMDDSGLQEIHQACRHGRAQHLEHLLDYGADINSQSPGNGNTPLHVCAYLGQESCARLLLFRGADRSLVNRPGHTAAQQAMLSDHHQLAQLIQDFREEDVVRIRVNPKFNTQRRTSIPILRAAQRSSSMGHLVDLDNYHHSNGTASAPLTPETRQMHTSLHSGGSSLFGGSSGLPSSANSSIRSSASQQHWSSKLASASNLKQSKGKGLSRSVCQLDLSDDDGAAAADCSTLTPTLSKKKKGGLGGFNLKPKGILTNWSDTPSFNGSITSDRIHNKKKKKSLGGSYGDLLKEQNRSSMVNLLEIDASNLPRMVVLQKAVKGFGFVIRGMKATGNPKDFVPTVEVPALQFFDKIDPLSPAKKAGLKEGDFILEVNGQSVVRMLHEDLVKLIRKSGDTVALKIVTAPPAQPKRRSTSSKRRTLKGTDPSPSRKYQWDSDTDASSVLSAGSRSGNSTRSSVGGGGGNSSSGGERTASIRTRSTKRITALELEEMHTRRGAGNVGSPASTRNTNTTGGPAVGSYQSQQGHQQQKSGPLLQELQPKFDGNMAAYSTFRRPSRGTEPDYISMIPPRHKRNPSLDSTQSSNGPQSPSPFSHPLPTWKRSAGAGSDSGVSLTSGVGVSSAGGGITALSPRGGPGRPGGGTAPYFTRHGSVDSAAVHMTASADQSNVMKPFLTQHQPHRLGSSASARRNSGNKIYEHISGHDPNQECRDQSPGITTTTNATYDESESSEVEEDDNDTLRRVAKDAQESSNIAVLRRQPSQSSDITDLPPAPHFRDSGGGSGGDRSSKTFSFPAPPSPLDQNKMFSLSSSPYQGIIKKPPTPNTYVSSHQKPPPSGGRSNLQSSSVATPPTSKKISLPSSLSSNPVSSPQLPARPTGLRMACSNSAPDIKSNTASPTTGSRPQPPSVSAASTANIGQHSLLLRDAMARRRQNLDRHQSDDGESTVDDLSPSSRQSMVSQNQEQQNRQLQQQKPAIPPGKPLKSALKNNNSPYTGSPSLPRRETVEMPRGQPQIHYPSVGRRPQPHQFHQRQHSQNSITPQGYSANLTIEVPRSPTNEEPTPFDHVLPPPDFFRDTPRSAESVTGKSFFALGGEARYGSHRVGVTQNRDGGGGGGANSTANTNSSSSGQTFQRSHIVYQV